MGVWYGATVNPCLLHVLALPFLRGGSGIAVNVFAMHAGASLTGSLYACMQETDHELRSVVNRLKQDTQALQGRLADGLGALQTSATCTEKLEMSNRALSERVLNAQDKLIVLEAQASKVCKPAFASVLCFRDARYDMQTPGG